MWRRIKSYVIEKVLGLNDSPHSIAMGVALGWLVMWTPTVGIQIGIYVILAQLLRVNKSAGIPVVFISNVVTALPLYWFVWQVGARVLGRHGDAATQSSFGDQLGVLLEKSAGLSALFTADFWLELWNLLTNFGTELWVGAAVLGVASAIPFYFITLWAVMSYRAMIASEESD